MIPSPSALLNVARHAACTAGDHVLTQIGRRNDTDAVLRNDIKHKLDRESQEIATAAILASYPDHAILGEETYQAILPDTPVRWVIDPIDGTVNFTHGLPIWCCSVAAQINQRTVAAVVYAPELRLRFEARVDGPATCNDVILHASTTPRLDQALLHTGAEKTENPNQSFRFLTRIAEVAQRPRVLGSAALDICWVAAGKTDGYFEPSIYIWDMAAASLILERSGGIGEILHRYDEYRLAFLATNPHIHKPLRDVIVPLLKK